MLPQMQGEIRLLLFWWMSWIVK